MTEPNPDRATEPWCRSSARAAATAYQTPVISLIDVGAYPELRSYFLSGQLNVAVCPNCQTRGHARSAAGLSRPGAEFLAIYFPQQLNIPELEKQKMIGELTQSLMRSLPPEQRKGYFLNPRQFVSRQSLADAVYGTMGISQEELDRQRKKAKLVEQFQVFADDPKGLQMMVKNNDKEHRRRVLRHPGQHARAGRRDRRREDGRAAGDAPREPDADYDLGQEGPEAAGGRRVAEGPQDARGVPRPHRRRRRG